MMAINGVLAQVTVRALADAEGWYERLFGRAPDARPMDGLIEWHLGAGRGVQVWEEPDRAGGSTVVLEVDDLDAFTAGVHETELTDRVPQDASASRILSLTDPDGNRIVAAGA